MLVIATTLDQKSAIATRDLRTRFATNCGLVLNPALMLAHFSWMSADEFEREPLMQILASLAQETEPFTVYTAGLGIFCGADPIVYVPIAKNERLLNLHRKIWDLALPLARSANPYYQPDRWMPHITLAYQNSDAARLACAVSDIAYQAIEIEVSVAEFALLGHTHGQGEVVARYPFANQIFNP